MTQSSNSTQWILTLMIGLFIVLPGAFACQPAMVDEIAPGVFVRPGHHRLVFEGAELANIGFIVGERCVAVIDTGGSPAEGEALACAIQAQTQLPVCQVINTHVHPDHMLGNSAFQGDDVAFIGHTNLARAMSLVGPHYLNRLQESGEPADQSWLVPPDQEVSDTLRLDLGNRELVLTAHAKAHTDNDLSVFDPSTGTLWLGDLLFVDHVPVLEGSLLGFLDTLETLKTQEAHRVVPGHGSASLPWPEAMADQVRYLTSLRDQTRVLLDRGDTLETALETVGQDEAPHWQLFEALHPRNVSTAYTELEWED